MRDKTSHLSKQGAAVPDRADSQSDDLLRTIINSSPFPIAVTDVSDERIHYWSQTALDTFGHNPGNVSEWYELAYPDPDYRADVIKRWKPFLDKASASDQAVNTGEYEIACKDGSIKICELHAQFIPGHLIITFNDITKRKQSELKNQRIAKDLALAQQISKTGNWSFDPAIGVPEWSDEIYRIYERDPELGPMPLAEYKTLYSPDQFTLFQTAISDAIEKGTPYSIELSLTLPSGKKKWVHAICEPLDEKGPHGYSLIGTIQDVTKRKQTELEMRRRVDYERALANVSAELSGLTFDTTDKAIDNALSILGKFTGSDRAYLFQFKNNLAQVDNTHEYCADGIEAQIDKLQNISLDDELPWLNKVIKAGEPIYIPAVDEMLEEAQREKEHFHSQNIKSLFVLPIKTAHTLIGFLGFDAVRQHRQWDDDDKSLLTHCCHSLGHFLEYQRAESESRRRQFIFSQTFEQSSTSTCLVDPDGTIIRVNDTFCRMFGVDKKTILAARHNIFEDPVAIEAGITSTIREVFEKRKSRRWEIDFDLARSWFETNTSTSKTERLYLEAFAFPVVNDHDEMEFVVFKHYDITERKQAERELAASENRFRMIFEHSPLAILLEDSSGVYHEFQRLRAEGVNDFDQYFHDNPRELPRFASLIRILKVNASGRDLLVAESSTDSPGNLSLYFDENSLPAFQKEIVSLSRGEKTVEVETSIPHPTRGRIHLQVFLQVIPGMKDNWSRVLVSFMDITERERAERKMRRAQKDLLNSKALLDATGHMAKVGGWELDTKTREITWTDETYRIFDFPLDGPPPVETLDLFHPEDRILLKKAVRKATNQRKPYNLDLRFTSAKGKELIARATGAPLISDGEVVKLQGTLQDITEIKKAEAALLQSQRNFRAVIDTLPLAFYLASGPDEVCQYMNPMFTKMFGYTMDEVPDAEHWFRLAYPDAGYRHKVVAEWENRITKASETKTPIEPLEALVTCKDGSKKTVLWGFAYTGEMVYAYGLDLTEQKQVQERLLHSEKMDAIGHLAGGVAHDFNNQLSGVLGYGDMLAKRLDDPNLRRYAENICRAARRSADLTQKLLAFSRKGQYQYIPVEMHKVIQETVEMLHHSIDKRIEIRQDLHAQKDMVDGDPSQLQNALLNLAINARDAMPAGGTVTFMTNVMELDRPSALAKGLDVEEGQYLALSITDTGCGIPDDVLPHVFEPFYTTKGQDEGTGMGLASVYGAVTQHKGDISVQSSVGQGTRFTVYLPLSDSVLTNSTAQVVSQALNKGLNILVVDDERMVRELACDILTAMGHSVLSATDGQEAVNLYREKWTEIDLVLLDMVMPRMSGHETFVGLREINPAIKVILASGYSLNQEAQAILDEGVKGFMSKPFDQTKLMVAIQKVMAD